mmetsp:Transcript_12826/g.10958  ORF Transcript_12826/g.10958 Transcript_12826/m.10958 type:complete len:107 (+) Transcript_12826:411-731(+)|eukprot:CAMPEP_0114578458 /NCGR_PEP_ID=MMETSP0125-20121206/2992_1 /TAXON_ID=485358 ORGANISM="Aristerostoma sp., Strain ATCC 50986" /NCGR_SAMPLE_ID=MMETSP0125 /ASSEMBLY_ACC=CAM_ASM_000245 /LENGTH=106 /DNA_ID=CAMNT_0001768537 /DNA_START=396 /DNA_END=716 /DNA_ORIENTATION=+
MIKNSCRKNVSVVLIGNKRDLESQREVSVKQGQEIANQNGFGFYETSAKDKMNIDSAFDFLMDTVLAKIEAGLYEPVSKGIKLEGNDNEGEGGFNCSTDAMRCSCL